MNVIAKSFDNKGIQKNRVTTKLVWPKILGESRIFHIVPSRDLSPIQGVGKTNSTTISSLVALELH